MGPQGPEGEEGPAGAAGPAGAQGPPGVSSGKLAGTVVNGMTDSGVSGVKVSLDPAIEGVSIETDGSGKFSADLPVGVYTLKFEKADFEPFTKTAPVIAGDEVVTSATLKPSTAVAVNAGEDQTSEPGETVSLTASVEALDGSSINGFEWTQVSGAPANLSGASSKDLSITLADEAAYKEELLKHIRLLDRTMVLGIPPLSLEEAETATFQVEVTTSSGTYSDTVSVQAHLPYVVSTGIENVPISLPVLLQGKDQGSYSWQLSGPSGSTASLTDANDRNPYFTPDASGQYTVTETNSGESIDVYAGRWVGAITGQNADGRPEAEECESCHNDRIAPDRFTDWRETGHAEIFTNNLNTSAYWGTQCMQCHSVGYNPEVDNGGLDDAPDFDGFLENLVGHPSPDNWETVLAEYPETARLANIQCENCHGPNDSPLHNNETVGDSARVSYSSDVCAACHGEPLRHGRFQQWELSKHGDFTNALAQATVDNRGGFAGHCARCHSAQGFVEWIKQDDLSKYIQGADGNATAEELTAMGLTLDEVQPQTCVACHEPHEQGKTSGEPNTATVRVSGDTKVLPAGFQAVGVGRGAICMTCHNTRNGEHNDNVGGTVDDHAPHTAAQADVLMGQNAFFVNVGARAPHSYIEDTCATCHMELTDPPEELSYNLSGTNHTFEPSMEICTECHGAFDGGTLTSAMDSMMEDLKHDIESALIQEMADQIAAGNNVVLVEAGEDDADVTITSADQISALDLTEYHGRMAMDITVDDTEYQHIQLGRGTKVGDGNLLSSDRGQTIAKATWNFLLVESDDSEGVHNPGFVNDVLTASIDALR